MKLDWLKVRINLCKTRSVPEAVNTQQLAAATHCSFGKVRGEPIRLLNYSARRKNKRI